MYIYIFIGHLPNCGNNEIIGDVVGWYWDVAAHRRFGVNTCGALADVIGSTGLRLIAVDEMVMDFYVIVVESNNMCADSVNILIEKETEKLIFSMEARIFSFSNIASLTIIILILGWKIS